MRPRHALLILPILAAPAPAHADGRPMTVEDLLAVKSVADPQISPDGKLVAYVVAELDRAAGKSNSDVYLVPTAGGEPRRLTTAPGADNGPRWSPDGKSIAFVSDRSGSSQVWLLPLDGGEARQLTKLPIDVAGPIWSPTGDKLAFVAEVYPGTTPEETARRDEEKAKSKSKARTYDSLMIRHWQAWDEGKRSHLFVADARSGEAKDLIPGWKANVPPAPFGGSSDYAWSPDGKELAFTSEPLENLAWSTNTDIWTVPAAGGEAENLTVGNKGADAQPAYNPSASSPLIAYLSQTRAGFESDTWVLKVANRRHPQGQTFEVSAHMDRPIQSFTWGHNLGILAVIDDVGTESIQPVSLMVLVDGSVVFVKPMRDVRRIVTGGVNTAVHAANGAVAFVRGDATHPAEVFTAKDDGSGLTQLTRHNEPLTSTLDLAKAEGFTFKGADNDDVSGWLVKPPKFDPTKKYPVLFLIHGGPQGAWHDEWHGRWNYQLFAAPGYAVVAINPRGSTGYGQKFTDQISGDWTGRVYEDLMKGLDHALKTYPFLDESRMAAAGGSYGGFMVNWIAGHSDRFKALISHAGVFDTPSKYGTTEELWFPEWEFGGTPWDKPENYAKASPSAFVANFRTPTLVTHGALDYRVPDAQGIGLFTALQRRGVPSRLVLFPDEGHWIAKPANRKVWWDEMHGWLAKYLR